MLGPLLLAAALNASTDPLVHVMIHVPLAGAPLPEYRRELRRYGTVIEHVGLGTWTDPRDLNARIIAEPVDHIEVVARLHAVRAFLPAFLRRMRIRQHQTETLAEIAGGAYGSARQTRLRIVVRLPRSAATNARLEQLHRLFADRGAGGDSQFTERGVVTDFSGVTLASAPRIERALRVARFAFTAEQETFFADDGANGI